MTEDTEASSPPAPGGLLAGEGGATGGGMTIEELASRSGATTRNIRNYQTLGLLPRPTLVGRVGRYDEGHLARLRLIDTLQEHGFSLAGIAKLVAAWEQGRSLADLLGFEAALTAPWNEDQPQELSPEELLEAFPEVARDPDLAVRAARIGLVEPAGANVRVVSPRLVAAGQQLVGAGVPLAAALDEFEALRADMDRVAARFVDLFDRHVWQPFADAGMPADQVPAVTEALERMRPLAAATVDAQLAAAMDRHTATATAARLRALGVPPAAHEEETA